MVIAMNSVSLSSNQNTSAYITSLCDVVPNEKRDEKDFQSLLQCLEHLPKECTPFKGKILLHLRIHALDNPNVNIRLLARCFAKATLLYRKTPNKSEGPLGCWKSALKGEILALDENLNQLYGIVGLTSSNILSRSTTDSKDEEEECLDHNEKLSESTVNFENIINEHLLKINLAAHNICALISVRTDFDLPIPVLILLKLATKIGLIRWKDYNKKPNGLLKNYVYSLAPCLLETNLLLFKSIITVLGSNVIPYTTSINQALVKILDWTKSSSLLRHYEEVYHTIRSQVFKMLTFMIEQLSLNLNLEPQHLKSLLSYEIVDNVEELICLPGSGATLRDQHIIDALECLENLLIVYRDLLDSDLASKCRSFVIQTCLKIYRDIDSNKISQTCRRKLLELLQSIANQPYATSTTEIAYHIFELAEKFEGDPEMRSLARRSLKIGLAHRPTLVTHYDVYNCYGRPMLSAEDLSSSQPLPTETAPLELAETPQQELPSSPEQAEQDAPIDVGPASAQEKVDLQVNAAKDRDECNSPDSDIMIIEQSQASTPNKSVGVANQEEEQAGKEDNELLPIMSLFVEELA